MSLFSLREKETEAALVSDGRVLKFGNFFIDLDVKAAMQLLINRYR